MEKIKLILAWLDWSTFAKTDDNKIACYYKFPRSLCQLAWRTLFSIVVLPITWITHAWNLTFVSMDTFRKEDSAFHKLNVWSTLLFNLAAFVLGLVLYMHSDYGSGGWGWDLFHMSDPIALTYIKLVGYGIIVGIVLLIFIGVFVLLVLNLFRFVDGFKIQPKKEENSRITKIFKAIKDKYCPMINWDSIKSKQN